MFCYWLLFYVEGSLGVKKQKLEMGPEDRVMPEWLQVETKGGLRACDTWH